MHSFNVLLGSNSVRDTLGNSGTERVDENFLSLLKQKKS